MFPSMRRDSSFSDALDFVAGGLLSASLPDLAITYDLFYEEALLQGFSDREADDVRLAVSAVGWAFHYYFSPGRNRSSLVNARVSMGDFMFLCDVREKLHAGVLGEKQARFAAVYGLKHDVKVLKHLRRSVNNV